MNLAMYIHAIIKIENYHMQAKHLNIPGMDWMGVLCNIIAIPMLLWYLICDGINGFLEELEEYYMSGVVRYLWRLDEK
jgi:hypothetical protein